jgi:hypothetical protein
MILPSKHISEEQALVGVGAVLLQEMKQSQTVTSLWERVRLQPAVGTFERFVLALDMMHMIGVVTVTNGMLERTGA